MGLLNIIVCYGLAGRTADDVRIHSFQLDHNKNYVKSEASGTAGKQTT